MKKKKSGKHSERTSAILHANLNRNKKWYIYIKRQIICMFFFPLFVACLNWSKNNDISLVFDVEGGKVVF